MNSVYKTKLENLRSKNLDIDFVSNIQHYDDFIKEKFKQYTKGIRLLKLVPQKGMSEYNTKFNMLLDGLVNLYPCLYKVNDTSLYPLAGFGYMNLKYLNTRNANDNIIMMANNLLKTYGWVLNNRYLLGE